MNAGEGINAKEVQMQEDFVNTGRSMNQGGSFKSSNDKVSLFFSYFSILPAKVGKQGKTPEFQFVTSDLLATNSPAIPEYQPSQERDDRREVTAGE